jgi:phosphatidylinositol kinase/protein kinase (PI-3  family)
MGQGKTFEIPEKVPFRLTHNMVEAMGVNGVEGMFLFSLSQFFSPYFMTTLDSQVKRS